MDMDREEYRLWALEKNRIYVAEGKSTRIMMSVEHKEDHCVCTLPTGEIVINNGKRIK
jgi:hypothetical protein